MLDRLDETIVFKSRNQPARVRHRALQLRKIHLKRIGVFHRSSGFPLEIVLSLPSVSAPPCRSFLKRTARLRRGALDVHRRRPIRFGRILCFQQLPGIAKLRGK